MQPRFIFTLIIIYSVKNSLNIVPSFLTVWVVMSFLFIINTSNTSCSAFFLDQMQIKVKLDFYFRWFDFITDLAKNNVMF